MGRYITILIAVLVEINTIIVVRQTRTTAEMNMHNEFQA